MRHACEGESGAGVRRRAANGSSPGSEHRNQRSSRETTFRDDFMISYGPPRLRPLAIAAVFLLHSIFPKPETAPVAWYDPRRHFIGWTLFGCACLGIIGLAFQWFRPSPAIQVSRQTTFLTAPLRSDGLPDFHLAKRVRQGQGIPPDQNAAHPFWQAMGRAHFSADHWAALCRELALQPSDDGHGLAEWDEQSRHVVEAWLQIQYPSHTATSWQSAAIQIVSRCQEAPWQASQCPPLAELLAHYAPYYDRLYKAAERKAFYSPSSAALVDETRIDLVDELTISLRSMVRALVQRAHLRLGEGDPQGAWADLQVGLQICGLPHHDSNVEVLVQNACENVLLGPLKYLLVAPELTSALAQEIHQTLDQLPEHISQLRESLDGERLFSIQYVVLASKDPVPLAAGDATLESARGLFSGTVDWNVTLKKINRVHDELATILLIDDAAMRRERLEIWEERLNQDVQQLESRWNRFASYLHPGKRSQTVADGLVGSSTGAYSMMLKVVEQAAVSRELVKIAARLAAYRSRSGDAPENLIDLVPDVFAGQPVDPVDGTSIRYCRLSGPNFLLYSVGPNGRDDQGSDIQNSIYRGLPLYQMERDRLRQALVDSGDPAPPTGSPEPRDWIPAGADDISWRTLPQPESLSDLIDRLVAQYTTNAPLSDSQP